MSRVCQVTGRRTRVGNKVARRGLAKYKGGIGIKTTGITRRRYKPNLQWKRVWVAELKRFVRVRVCAKALKAMASKGAYRVLLDAGLVKPPRPKKGKKAAAVQPAV
ncbi:MAG: 50S ribosomal protein L28 [Planctomycetes bacterium]|nr:50S ribosomal protein L28 [Planctomycetota bacterium]